MGMAYCSHVTEILLISNMKHFVYNLFCKAIKALIVIE